MNTIYGFAFPTITSQITYNETTEGEPIERRVERIMEQNEPITDGAPIIYTKRNEGVIPEYNVRTDRFELALEMTDAISKQAYAKREEFHKNLEQQQKQQPQPPQSGETPSTGQPTS